MSIVTNSLHYITLYESCLWLAGLFRKLGGRRSIRQPFYGKIYRDVPVYIFNALFEAIKLS